MTEQQKLSLDFRQFWIKFRKPDGTFLGSPAFNRDAFVKVFGEDAADAFVKFRDSGIKRKSSSGNEEMFKTAKATLDRLCINPQKVIDGIDTNIIEDL